jgi:hypothetical protein
MANYYRPWMDHRKYSISSMGCMATSIEVRRPQAYLLWGMLLLYMLARFCQLYADRLPSLLIVILHVVPLAIFALVHGSILYRVKGMSMFAVFCLGFGAVAESLSLRTGFPLGTTTSQK